MNIVDFINNLANPKIVSEDSTADLEAILDEFPYFQAAQFLYLNCLKNQNSFKYNNHLKKTAAYTTDRTVLFDFICADDYRFNYSKDDASEFFELQPLEKEENPSIDHTETIKNEGEAEEITLGKPFRFKSSDNYSFNEWLQISSILPIERDQDVSVDSAKKVVSLKSTVSKSNKDLIEKFIATNPKISPVKTLENHQQLFDSTIENESLMTETLAHVYLEQKKYQKAIMAFTVLSLKYPEKSSFFANQINAIEKLQEK